MDVDTILKIIQLYGFPAVMCLWFMVRLEKRLDKIAEDNHKQVVVLAVLVRILGDKRAQAFGTIPDDFIEDVTGVTEIPIPQGAAEEIQGSKKKGAGQ